MTLSHAEREEIHAYHKRAGEQFRKTGKYPRRPERIIALQKKAVEKAVEPDETDTPPRPAPAPAHTNGTENIVRRQEDLDRRTAEIKAARKKEADENQAEINRILDQRDIPGMATARARQRTGEHHVLEASDLDDFGRVVPGRRSFRTGQTRQ